MSLLDLPLHLVSSIVASIQPYDFESFALACHGTYRLLTPLLARHNAYRQGWQNVAFGGPLPPICSPTKRQSTRRGEPKKLRTTRQLLVQIAQDPECVRYVRHLDISGREYPSSDEYVADSDDSDTSTSSAQDRIALKRIVTDLAAVSPTLQHLDPELPHWFHNLELDEEYQTGGPDYSTLFLLSILPNLRTLTLQEECDVEFELLNVDAQADTLQPVVAEGSDYYTQFGIDMTILLPFLTTPSVRNVRFMGGVLCEIGDDFWDCYRPVGTQVERLEVDYSCVDVDAGKVLLQDMTSLRVLKLNYESKDNMNAYCGYQDLMDVVGKAAGKTLEVLSLATSSSYDEYVETPLRSLRRFRRLKELELTTSVFYLRAGGHIQQGDLNRELDLEADYEYQCEFKEDHDYVDDDDEDDQSEADSQHGSTDEDEMDQDDADDTDDDGSDSQSSDDDEDMDGDNEGSDQEDNRFYLEGKEAQLAKTCPSLAQLLSSKSIARLKKLTLHVEAEEADLLCMKRLLRNLHGVGVGGRGGGNAQPCPRLTSVAVCLYTQNRNNQVERPGAQRVIRLAQEYLSGIPGCKVRVVPYEGTMYASRRAWHASVAFGEVDDE